jgi:hypothetical protein
MKKKIKSTLELLKYIVKENGGLPFRFEATSYGLDFNSYLPPEVEENLEDIMREFDSDFHSDNGLEVGSSRNYRFEFVDETLYGFIDYEWDYSYLGTKSSDDNLEDLLVKEIEEHLSRDMSISHDEFQANYYFIIKYSTDGDIKEDSFVLFVGKEEEENPMSSDTIFSLKKLIHDVSFQHGANTQERDCHFDYYLTIDNSSLIERWQEKFDCAEYFSDKKLCQIEI